MKITLFCIWICLSIVATASAEPLAVFSTEQLQHDGYYTFVEGSPAVAQEFIAQQPYVNTVEIHGLIPQQTEAASQGGAVVFYKTDDFRENGTQAEVIYGHSITFYAAEDCTAEHLPAFLAPSDCTLAVNGSFTLGTWIHNNVPLNVGENYTFVLYMSPGVQLRASLGNGYEPGEFYQLNMDNEAPGGLVAEILPDTDLWFRLGLLSDPTPRIPAHEFRIRGQLESVSQSGTPDLLAPNLVPGDYFDATLSIGFDAVEMSSTSETATHRAVQTNRLEISVGDYFFEYQGGQVDMQDHDLDAATFIMDTLVHSSIGRGAYANRAVITVVDHNAAVFESLQFNEIFKLADFIPTFSELLISLHDSGDDSGALETRSDGYLLRFNIESITAVPEHSYTATFELQNGGSRFYARAVTFDEWVTAAWRVLAGFDADYGSATGEGFTSPSLYHGAYEVELQLSDEAMNRTQRQWFTYNRDYRKLLHPTVITQTKDSDGDGGRDTFQNNPNQIELATSAQGVAYAGVGISDARTFSNNAMDYVLYLEAELLSPGSAGNWVHVWLKDYASDTAEMLVDGTNNTRWLGSFQPQDYSLGAQRFRLNPSIKFNNPEMANGNGYQAFVMLTSTASADDPVVLGGIKPEKPVFALEPSQMPNTSSSSSSSSSGSGSTSSSSSTSTSSTTSSTTTSSSGHPGVGVGSSSSTSSSSSSSGGYQYPLECELHVYNEWDDGMLVGVDIHNSGETTVNNWSMRFQLSGEFTMQKIWNAEYIANGAEITTSPKSYNAQLNPDAHINFGFILEKPQHGSLSISGLSEQCQFQ